MYECITVSQILSVNISVTSQSFTGILKTYPISFYSNTYKQSTFELLVTNNNLSPLI